MKKPSFLERLTGTVNMTDEYDDVLEQEDSEQQFGIDDSVQHESDWQDQEPEVEEEGELPVDMYQTGEAIVIRALVAGVSPDDMDIGITRDMVTIRGQREEYIEAESSDYFHRELFWGSFSRKILLPEEILIDEAEANEKHGLLEIVLPKVDKDRSTKLKIKTTGK